MTDSTIHLVERLRGDPGITCAQLPPWVSVGHYAIEPDALTKALVTMEHKLWPNGSTITYSFLDGQSEPQLKETVSSAIAEYQRYANLNFKKLADGSKSANIRIKLKSESIRSAVGIDALRMDDGPTMQLGYSIGHRDENMYPLALHGIGHALGLMHDKEGSDPHSNFPNPDKNSVMWMNSIYLSFNPQLSASDKAWLVVNYPGRDAAIDGTGWTLMHSLGVLHVPAPVIASILMSSDVSKKRDIYTQYIIKLYGHVHVKAQVESIQVLSEDDALSHEPSDEPPSLDDLGFTDVSNDTPATPLLSQPDDDEFSESVAAAVMHPQFRAALSNVVQQYINDNASELGVTPKPVAAQPSNAVQSADPQHFLGALVSLVPLVLPTAIDLVSKLVQTGIQPNNSQSALRPNGIQSFGSTGRTLSPAEQQVMNGFFTSIISSPVFKSALKGVINTVADQDSDER